MNNYDKQINLVEDLNRSSFLNELLKKELSYICENKNICNESLNLVKNYISENDTEIQCGVFIINNSNTDIYLRELPVRLKVYEKIIFEEWIIINKDIKAQEAIFQEIIISKEKIDEEYDLNLTEVIVGRINDLRAYEDIEIKEYPKFNKYGAYREMKKFIRELPLIEENQIRIDKFKVGALNEGLCIINLFRNSSKREINIKSIPIEVYTEKEILIYKGTYILENGFNIGAKEGKFYNIIIPWSNFLISEASTLHNFYVKFVE